MLNCTVTLPQIILGGNGHVDDFIISLVSFYIYKYWLICKNDGKPRVWKDIRKFLISEINYSKEIYKLTKLREFCSVLEGLKYKFIQCV